MNLTLDEIISKIASQGKNPDVSFLKDNPQAQAMLLLAILSSNNSNTPTLTSSSKAEKKSSKKVGRKPVASDDEDSDNPKSKRKAQNRAAQRAFRERKENQVRVLEDKVKELESLGDKQNEKLILENQLLKDMIKKLQDENASILSSTVSFDVPLSSINDADERPQKIKRQNYSSDTSPVSTNFDSLSSYSSKSGSNTPETQAIYNSHVTVDDILNNSNLPSSALLGHSELLGLSNNKIDFSTSQLDNILQQQSFSFETDPTQFDFFYPIESTATTFQKHSNQRFASSSKASSLASSDKKDISQLWDQISEHPRFEEFNIDALCEDMNQKAVCIDDHNYDEELKKVIEKHYPIQN